MRFIYPAVIHPNEDGTYTATMVDLEGCSATGFSIDDCLEEINAAALNWITIELEEDGVINRVLYPVVPPKTEYSLTEMGETLVPIVEALCKWGEHYFELAGVPIPCGE